MTPIGATCFHEADAGVTRARRAAAEGVGTLLLVLAACGAGLAAPSLLPGQPRLAVVLVALAVAGALVSLIVALGKLSGGHYNPLVSVKQALAGERSVSCAAAFVAARWVGGVAGGVLAAALWRTAPAPSVGGIGWPGAAYECVASASLMLVVFGASRSGRAETGPFAVGARLVAVIGTPTTSYANPAVVVGAWLSAGPVALGAASVLPYVVAESTGALLALGVVAVLFDPPVKVR